MSSWAVTDDTPTATVVWTAAEQIGKAQNHEQLQKICDYLVNKHWFQTAADLRSARREATEWQALEVPGRLKLAIQQVLDQTTIHQEPYGYEDYYAAVRPSLTPGSESTTQQWADTTEQSSTEVEQTSRNYYSSGCAYASSDTTTYYTNSGQYGYEQTNYSTASNLPTYDESSTANYDYYNSSYASTYSSSDSGVAATTLLSLQRSGGKLGEEQSWGENEVVEAHAIEVEVAEECNEGELVPDQPSYHVELGEPSQADVSETSGRWSCGQCTYLNPMTSSFCEMCISHISLSPDVKTAAGTSASASLLIPAKPMVDVVMDSPRTEPSACSSVETSQPSLTCMLPPVDTLYRPSAPDFETSDILEEERIDPSPLPPPPAYPGTNSCGNVDFLALAFSGSSAPKKQAPSGPSSSGKTSLMRREEVPATTEYTF